MPAPETERIPVNPGTVEWSGENPGIYLRETEDGPWLTLATFFRVVLSPHGRGHAMIVLDQPDVARGYPDTGNLCVTDNVEMTRYLVRDFVSRFPTFRDRKGLAAMSWHELTGSTSSGDLAARWTESVTADGIEAVMSWSNLGEPFAVEVGPNDCATGRHDMYSVFLEARDASVTVNGRRCAGRVTGRQFFGRRMSTAFMALSETWVTPASG